MWKNLVVLMMMFVITASKADTTKVVSDTNKNLIILDTSSVNSALNLLVKQAKIKNEEQETWWSKNIATIVATIVTGIITVFTVLFGYLSVKKQIKAAYKNNKEQIIAQLIYTDKKERIRKIEESAIEVLTLASRVWRMLSLEKIMGNGSEESLERIKKKDELIDSLINKIHDFQYLLTIQEGEDKSDYKKITEKIDGLLDVMDHRSENNASARYEKVKDELEAAVSACLMEMTEKLKKELQTELYS